MITDRNDLHIPDFISRETFFSLSWKEQDFILLLYARKFTQTQIMRMLYITSRAGYYKLRKKITKIIQKEQERKKVSTE